MAGPEGCDPGLEAGIAHEPGATEPIPNTTTLLGEPRWKELDDEVVRHLASLGLRVEMSAVKGRSLVALRLFRAGEIVLQQASPYVSADPMRRARLFRAASRAPGPKRASPHAGGTSVGVHRLGVEQVPRA
jgi:hypothetical protein